MIFGQRHRLLTGFFIFLDPYADHPVFDLGPIQRRDRVPRTADALHIYKAVTLSQVALGVADDQCLFNNAICCRVFPFDVSFGLIYRSLVLYLD